MSNLKEIRTRISSVTTTRRLPAAHENGVGCQLKKAQDAILHIRPYAGKIHEILTLLTACLENTGDSPYTEQRPPEKVLIVLISSNRGLCGAFNSSISKKAVELAFSKTAIRLKQEKQTSIRLENRGERFLKSRKMHVAGQANHIFEALHFDPGSACRRTTNV